MVLEDRNGYAIRLINPDTGYKFYIYNDDEKIDPLDKNLGNKKFGTFNLNHIRLFQNKIEAREFAYNWKNETKSFTDHNVSICSIRSLIVINECL